MSDRYKPRQLLRERQAQIARGEAPASQQQRLWERLARDEHQRLVPHCSHGAPWRTCTFCSKPRAR